MLYEIFAFVSVIAFGCWIIIDSAMELIKFILENKKDKGE